MFLNYRQEIIAKRAPEPDQQAPILPRVQAAISGLIIDEAFRGKSAARDTRDAIHLEPDTYRQRSLNAAVEDAEVRRLRLDAEHKQAVIRQSKRARGLAEVTVNSLVLVEDLQAAEKWVYYIASGDLEVVKGQKVFVERYATPPGGADAVVRVNTPAGKALLGAFVSDVVTVYGIENLSNSAYTRCARALPAQATTQPTTNSGQRSRTTAS